MKKIISIALVALFVASTAFAGFSGDASLSLGYNFKNGKYGFSNANSVNVNLDLSSETAEAVGEGEVVAGIKATFSVKLANKNGDKGTLIWDKGSAEAFGIGAFFSVKEAYVKGADWKVAIKGTQDGPDFAKSAIDGKYETYGQDAFGNAYYDIYVPTSFSVAYNKAPGVVASFKDWKIGLGFNGEKDSYLNYHVSAFTPSITVAEGLTVQAAAIASADKSNKDDNSKNYDAFGASAQVAYASDAISTNVAADFGMKKVATADEFKSDFDVAANVAVSVLTVDGYYNYGEKLLSAKVKADLNDLEVPVALTLTGKDLLNGKNLSAKVSASVDAIEGALSVGYGIESKKLSVAGSVKYAAEKFTASAGANFATVVGSENAKQFYVTASIESDAIIPGATLSLTYADPDGEDLNFLKGQTPVSQNFGAVAAKCSIAF